MRKASALAVAVGLTLCLALAAAAPALAAPGTIEGRVSEPEEDEGKGEVQVCALPAAAPGPAVACAETEVGSGHYELSLEPGEYKLLYTPPDESIYVYQYYFRKLRFSGAKAVEVESGGSTTIDVVLEIGGLVSGRVTDTGGFPIDKADVCIFNELVPELGVRCTKTAANGAWGMIGLPSGSYTASFSTPPERNFFPQFFKLSPTLAGAEEFAVLPGEETDKIDAKLESGVTIEGGVSEAGTGLPLQGIRVCLLDAGSEAEVRCTTSGADGRYRMLLLRPGSYVAGFSVTPEQSGSPVGEEDGYVRQYFEDQPTFAAADPISALQPGIYGDVDAHLVKGPEVFPRPSGGSGSGSSAPLEAAPAPGAKPRPLRCRKHFRRAMVKGKPRCVKVHRQHRNR